VGGSPARGVGCRVVKIRLRRQGAKKHAFYRLVVAEASAPRNGRFLAEIGYYDPTTDPPVVHVEVEEALRWLRNGAQPTETARSLLSKAGVMAQLRGQPARPEGR
jgi:small subunit ribosomal protein S16